MYTIVSHTKQITQYIWWYFIWTIQINYRFSRDFWWANVRHIVYCYQSICHQRVSIDPKRDSMKKLLDVLWSVVHFGLLFPISPSTRSWHVLDLFLFTSVLRNTGDTDCTRLSLMWHTWLYIFLCFVATLLVHFSLEGKNPVRTCYMKCGNPAWTMCLQCGIPALTNFSTVLHPCLYTFYTVWQFFLHTFSSMWQPCLNTILYYVATHLLKFLYNLATLLEHISPQAYKHAGGYIFFAS